MPGIENINIDFTFSPLLIVLGIIVLAGYTFYIYKYTVPQVSPFFKYFLVTLRALTLALILIVIFEPVVSIKFDEEENPKTFVFVDESRSIVSEDSASRSEQIKNILSQLSDKTDNEIRFYSFAGKVDSLPANKINEIDFPGGLTNLNSVINFLNSKKENISSAILISDGIITDGSSPVYEAEKLAYPLFTIGIGDTTERNDININKVLRNDYIYTQKPTIITANILNKGFENKTISVRLSENNKLIEQKIIGLNESGINKIEFEYKPLSAGEKKLTFDISRLDGEVTFANNSNSFFINVLDNKVRILLVAGSPSEDLSFIKNSLKSDENLEVNSMTQISQNKFLEGENYNSKIDSADVLFLIGFPAANTPPNLINKISENIKSKTNHFLFH